MMTIFVLLILAFSIAGASYAAWTSSVTINGSATIGDIDLRIVDIAVNETPVGATITASVTNSKTVQITADNLYPGAEFNITLTTENQGTLPLKYYSFQCTDFNNDALDDYFWLGFVSGTTYNMQGSFFYLHVWCLILV